MKNIDSIWFTNTSTGTGSVHDMWSYITSTPSRDKIQNVITTTQNTNPTTKATTFTVMRSLDTGDAEFDKIITCNTNHEY